MSDRSYEDAADEFERLNWYQSIVRFNECFEAQSLGELMALGSKFLELAHEEAEVDERETSQCFAQTIEEVILFRLKGNETGIRAYLAAKQAQLENLQKHMVAAPVASGATQVVRKGVLAWFGKRK
ncbi:hypothetical protein LNV09_22920 [Paucibacter sp. B2R-40]|uniref:hypothetical protein n=1 Tax=Paucibacter sp. B2R-40 TaxID=2893554 RepID=UPI0021E40929|nr:hypothetical protein [Paucibacter sp. B2R-40]MCV2357006.1 hypothetical protein [Paucibacter sp. B2R-40]